MRKGMIVMQLQLEAILNSTDQQFNPSSISYKYGIKQDMVRIYYYRRRGSSYQDDGWR
jgi:hypothetical protein